MSTPRRIVDSLYGVDSLYIHLNYLLHCLFLLLCVIEGHLVISLSMFLLSICDEPERLYFTGPQNMAPNYMSSNDAYSL